jgi:cbb3-type cytochrome oxidase subunit 3
MHFDLNVIRSIVTVALFVLFVLLCLHVCSAKRRADFDAAARLPFDEGEL